MGYGAYYFAPPTIGGAGKSLNLGLSFNKIGGNMAPILNPSPDITRAMNMMGNAIGSLNFLSIELPSFRSGFSNVPPSRTWLLRNIILPFDGATVSSGYGSRDGRVHEGVDLVAPYPANTLGTPVRATISGSIER